MFHWVFAFLLVAHGSIHLLGFVKEFGFAEIPELTGRTLLPLSRGAARIIGLLWFVAAVLFIGASLGVLVHAGWWWRVAGLAVLLSQALIIVAWPDAKAGTIPNAVIVCAFLIAFGQWSFTRQIEGEVKELLSSASSPHGTVVTEADLIPLPPIVQRWLLASGVVGRERASTVRLKQLGLLRTSADQAWMPATATQYFTVAEPAFIWTVDVTMAGMLPLAGRDRYVVGHGNMLIKALSLVPVVNAADDKIDQGSLLRYLGEIVWFPSAALAPYITWAPVDSTTARATLTHGGHSVSGDFRFDQDGRFLSMSARRFMGSGNEATMEDWFIPAREWKEFDGVMVPSRGDVIWKLATGDFNYYSWEITTVEVNVPEAF